MSRSKRITQTPLPIGSAADMRTGLVITGHGRHCLVRDEAEGSVHLCHPRAKKNEALVGDRVQWLPELPERPLAGQQGVIEAIAPRRNVLYRQDELRTKSFAANIDQVLILIAAEPTFSASQLMRALIACAHAGIEPVIVLNKRDLVAPFAAAWQRLAPYRAWHRTLGLSLQDACGIAVQPRPKVPDRLLGVQGDGDGLLSPETTLEALHTLLYGRTTLVLGPSGSGKSTLINHAAPSARAAVGEISTALNSGRHTTTATRLYFLDEANTRAGAIVDSPGFQEFGLHHIAAADLARYFPDFVKILENTACRFHNCTHLHEPGCPILAALQNQTLDAQRWKIYAQLHEELSQLPRY